MIHLSSAAKFSGDNSNNEQQSVVGELKLAMVGETPVVNETYASLVRHGKSSSTARGTFSPTRPLEVGKRPIYAKRWSKHSAEAMSISLTC